MTRMTPPARTGGRGFRLTPLAGAALLALASLVGVAASPSRPATEGAVKTAMPALTVSAPSFADIALDEPHGLLYGSDPSGGKVWVLSLPSLTTVTTIDMGGPASHPVGMDLSADGSMLAVACFGAGNVALVDTASFLTVYPASGSQPLASNLNWSAGKTVPNRVIWPWGRGAR